MSDFDTPDIDDTTLGRSLEDVAALLEGTGVSLDDAALWTGPSAELEASIMAAIADEAPERTVSTIFSARSLRWLAPLAAAAAALIAFVAFSGSPDWEVTLGGTDAAPGASAVAFGWNEDNGTRVELDVEGLEPAPEGFFYELWFSSEDIHISAGTFHGTGDGVTLWAGVSRGDFPRVWITLEPIDNDESPAVNILDTAVTDAVGPARSVT